MVLSYYNLHIADYNFFGGIGHNFGLFPLKNEQKAKLRGIV
jgi:hypothetical protein